MTITHDAATRLDLAGTREFACAGSGIARRERLTRHGLGQAGKLFQEACRQVLGGRRDGVALAVVGSLARGETGPLSDVDLILLHDGRTVAAQRINALADRIWYPLWDAGVRLDHAVRTPAQSRKVATDDLSAAVGLLDLRHVAGDATLSAAVQQTVAHDWRANARTRLPELVEHVGLRHARHGDLTSALEPDLKEGRGGLRDMSILRALTAAWLADRPHGRVDEAYATLLDARDAVHVVTGRGRDRLSRQDQDAAAALLGHPDADALLTEVSRAARSVAFSLESTLRRATQARKARSLRVGPRRAVMRALGHGLFEHDGEVVLGPRTAPGDMLLLLRAAAAAAHRGVPLASATLRNLTRDLAPVSQPWPEALRDGFVDLLAGGSGLVSVWESLDLAGVVTHLIPEWKAVSSRPQRSPVHRHTVDRHLIETVVEAAGRRRDVDRPDLLLVVALLHDIGKIAGVHDHAVEGAPVAASIARRMGFAEDDVKAVELLVCEHLTLVDLATRRDPGDQQTVCALVGAIEERPELLEQLRVLTEADAVAAGPAAWTGWRATLVDELTDRARTALAGRHVAPSEPVPSAFVLSPTATDALLMGDPHVTVTPVNGGASIDIVDRDRLGLFADTAGLLASHGLVVRAARVRTTERAAINTWRVEAPGGDLPSADDLGRSLRRVAAGDRAPLAVLERSRPGQALEAAPARATIEPLASHDATVLEVRAADRPGLLRDIGITLARYGLAVRSAHVATYAGQTLDTFYVTSAQGTTLEPPQVARLISAVIDACESGA